MGRFVTALGLAAMAVAATAAPAAAQTSADSAAIVATALDYIDGFYTGDAARMERAVHPDLAKRIIGDPAGPDSKLQNMTAERLIQATASGAGGRIPEEARKEDVRILDIYNNMAAVRIDAGLWIDYLQLSRWNGEWKIINVLWELTPQD